MLVSERTEVEATLKRSKLISPQKAERMGNDRGRLKKCLHRCRLKSGGSTMNDRIPEISVEFIPEGDKIDIQMRGMTENHLLYIAFNFGIHYMQNF